jgi:hypothetical protein
MDAPTVIREARDPRVREAIAVARRYCELIDASGADCPHWLSEIAAILPRLHAVMSSFNYPAPDAEHDHPVNLDARFELYSHLRDLLADRDGYFLAFDAYTEGREAMSGSLADDLTDIYCELKHGLRAFSSDPAHALETWLLGYEHHWCEHLVDAERHLANLAASDRLG